METQLPTSGLCAPQVVLHSDTVSYIILGADKNLRPPRPSGHWKTKQVAA